MTAEALCEFEGIQRNWSGYGMDETALRAESGSARDGNPEFADFGTGRKIDSKTLCLSLSRSETAASEFGT